MTKDVAHASACRVGFPTFVFRLTPYVARNGDAARRNACATVMTEYIELHARSAFSFLEFEAGGGVVRRGGL
jgi:hypothetical protein